MFHCHGGRGTSEGAPLFGSDCDVESTKQARIFRMCAPTPFKCWIYDTTGSMHMTYVVYSVCSVQALILICIAVPLYKYNCTWRCPAVSNW